MDWNAIGAVGEVLGAIAVFVTLVYLARQVNESNKLAKSTSAKDVMNGFGEVNALATQASLAKALSKMRVNGEEVSAEQDVQLRQYCLRLLNVYLQAEAAHKNDNLDDQNFELVKADIVAFLDYYPGSARIWTDILEAYPIAKDRVVMQGVRTALDAATQAFTSAEK